MENGQLCQVESKLVQCAYYSVGCSWTGEKGELRDHLNLEPVSSATQFQGCRHAMLKCMYCSRSIERGLIALHQLEQCNQRPFICKYCGRQSTFCAITQRHWPGVQLTSCPNGCGAFAESRDLQEKHKLNDCPLERIQCDFQYFGCKVCKLRKDMPEHLAGNVISHLSMVAAFNKKRVEEQDLKIKMLEDHLKGEERKAEMLLHENQSLKRKVTNLSKLLTISQLQHFQLSDGIIPILFCFDKYKEFKQEHKKWYSPPFLTHRNGYKLCICIVANGTDSGLGTHASVSVHLMQGEFDDQLNWPLKASITIQIMNQFGEHHHHTKDITINFENRVTHRKKGGGFGAPSFLPHHDLESKYVKNDRIYLLILSFSCC